MPMYLYKPCAGCGAPECERTVPMRACDEQACACGTRLDQDLARKFAPDSARYAFRKNPYLHHNRSDFEPADIQGQPAWSSDPAVKKYRDETYSPRVSSRFGTPTQSYQPGEGWKSGR